MKRRYKLSILVGIVVCFLAAFLYAWKSCLSNKYIYQSEGTFEQDKQSKLANSEDTFKDNTTYESDLQQEIRDDLLPKEKIHSEVSENDLTNQLELPSPITEDEINRLIIKMDAKMIWKAQDETVRRRPIYSKLREQLLNEIQLQTDIENMTAEELVNHGIQYRERFWEAGGLLSTVSYHHAYKARLLLEQAHAREPKNLEIIDEFVETIQAGWPAVMFDKETNEKIRNEEINKLILELRSQQFAQIKKEIQNKREPCIDDFIRAVDLAVLLSIYDNAKAKGVVEWLQTQASDGGWDAYKPQLDKFHDYVDRGMSYYCQIYIATKGTDSQVLRYARRSPSFRGPNTEKRGIVLWGERFRYDQVSR